MPHRSFRTGRGYEIQWQSFWESTAIRLILVSNLYFLCEVASSCQIFLLKRTLSLIYTGHARRVDAVEIFHKTNIVVPEAVLRQIHNPSPTSCRMITSVSVAWTITETVSGLKHQCRWSHRTGAVCSARNRQPAFFRRLETLRRSVDPSKYMSRNGLRAKRLHKVWLSASCPLWHTWHVAYWVLWPWQAHQC